MQRRWPYPPEDRTLHCIGDLHTGATTQQRFDIVADDLARPSMPSLATHLQLGDFTNDGTTAQDQSAIAYMNAIGGDWYAVVGNHDVASSRTAQEAALAWGMPGKDYVVDLGYAVVIALGFDAINNNGMIFRTTTMDWLNTQLLAHSGQPCLLAAHPPLHETVGVGDDNTVDYLSTDPFFFAVDESAYTGTSYDDGDIRAVIADNPNAKAWLSGHTHSPLSASRLVMSETIGGHTVAHVNTSAIYYTGRTVQWTDRLATAYLTVNDDSIEVRYRDHGAHQWVGSSKERRQVWTIPL